MTRKAGGTADMHYEVLLELEATREPGGSRIFPGGEISGIFPKFSRGENPGFLALRRGGPDGGSAGPRTQIWCPTQDGPPRQGGPRPGVAPLRRWGLRHGGRSRAGHVTDVAASVAGACASSPPPPREAASSRQTLTELSVIVYDR